jgi:hypothetical protein
MPTRSGRGWRCVCRNTVALVAATIGDEHGGGAGLRDGIGVGGREYPFRDPGLTHIGHQVARRRLGQIGSVRMKIWPRISANSALRPSIQPRR